MRRFRFTVTDTVDGEKVTEEYDFEIDLPSNYALENINHHLWRLAKILRDVWARKRRITRDRLIELLSIVNQIGHYNNRLCSLVMTALRTNPCYAWHDVLNSIAYNIMKLSIYAGNDGWLKSAIINNAEGWGRTVVFFPLFSYKKYSWYYKRKVDVICGVAVTSWRSRKVKGGRKITYKGFVSFMCSY